MEREFNSTFHNNSYIYSVLPTFQVPVQELDLDYLFELRLLVAQLVKNLPSMLETWVQSLGWEYLLEKGKATHSSILAYGSEAFQMAQMVKSLPAMPETQVRSLGWEDLLEKEMAVFPVFLSGKSHGRKNLAIVHGITKSRTRLSNFNQKVLEFELPSSHCFHPQFP